MSNNKDLIDKFKAKSFGNINSMIHKFGGDPRLIVAAPCALLLQVAHPTVSAGVKEHSDYLQDPWGRLLRTLDFVYVMTYGEKEDMITMGETIKELHKSIRGTKSDGTKYSALEPEAYAWVHNTLAYFFIKGNEVFGTPMSKEEKEEFWIEWKEIGYLIHVQKKSLPETWEEFEQYFNDMIETKLQKTPEVCDLLKVLQNPPPPHKLLKGKFWNKSIQPVSNFTLLATIGMLPSNARKLFGFEWTLKDRIAFAAYVKLTRLGTPVVKKMSKYSGKLYLKIRRSPINSYYKIGMK